MSEENNPKMIIKSLYQTIYDEMRESCERLGIIGTEYKIPTGAEYMTAIKLVVLSKDVDYLDQYGDMTCAKKIIVNNPFLTTNRVATIGYNENRGELDSDGRPCESWSLILIADRLQKMFGLSNATMEENKQILALEMRYLLSVFKLIIDTRARTINDIRHELKNLESLAAHEELRFAGWHAAHLKELQYEETFIECKQRFFSMMSSIYERYPYASKFSNDDFMKLYQLRAKANWY